MYTHTIYIYCLLCTYIYIYIYIYIHATLDQARAPKASSRPPSSSRSRSRPAAGPTLASPPRRRRGATWTWDPRSTPRPGGSRPRSSLLSRTPSLTRSLATIYYTILCSIIWYSMIVWCVYIYIYIYYTYTYRTPTARPTPQVLSSPRRQRSMAEGCRRCRNRCGRLEEWLCVCTLLRTYIVMYVT